MEMRRVTHLPYHVQISLSVALESCVKWTSAAAGSDDKWQYCCWYSVPALILV